MKNGSESFLPPATQAALCKLGEDLAIARLRRRESLSTWAKRMHISVPTLRRLESGDPSVSLGTLATALWMLNRDSGLSHIASPEKDIGALEKDVNRAIEEGVRRSKSATRDKELS